MNWIFKKKNPFKKILEEKNREDVNRLRGNSKLNTFMISDFRTARTQYMSVWNFLWEPLILASINLTYDKTLFIELKVQYKKNASSVHIVYIKLFWLSKQFDILHNMY